MVRIISTALLLLSILGNTSAQSNLDGSWEEYLPYHRCHLLAMGTTQVFVASKNGVLIYDRETDHLQRLSKVQGLSDFDITALAYHPPTQQLIIGYANGNLDFYSENGVLNLPAIRIKSLPASKTIHRICILENKVYLACGFGLVELDPEAHEIGTVHYPGNNESYLPVFDLASDGSRMVLATSKGARFSPIDSSGIPLPANWQEMGSLPDGKKQLDAVVFFEGSFYANHRSLEFRQDSVWKWANEEWTVVDGLSNETNYALEVDGDQLVLTHSDWIQIVDKNLQTKQSYYDYQSSRPPQPRYAVRRAGRVWIADGTQGLVFGAANQLTIVAPKGPSTADVTNMAARNGQLWVAPGGKNGGWRNRWNQSGVFGVVDGDWKTIDRSVEPGLDTVFDFIAITSDPNDPNHVFAASLGDGLAEFNDGKLTKLYNHQNSTLKRMPTANTAWNWVGVTDVSYDSEGQLWVTNTAVSNAFSVRTVAGDWHSFDFTGLLNGHIVDQTVLSQTGTKWAVLPRGGGVLIFREEGSLEDTSDDRARILSHLPDAGNFPSDLVHCLVEDHDSTMWIGTEAGLVAFRKPETVIWEERVSDAERVPAISENTLVKTIAVDNRNRKWVGTENKGLFLIDQNGETVLAQFNKENSPLFSNTVLTLEYDPSIDKLYIGTDQGILSFQSIEPEEVMDCETIYAFPNPVPSHHQSAVTIAGLKTKATVRITDLSGNVVFEAISDGDSLDWDQRRLNGDPVQTGVYLVHTQTANGREACTTKLLLIN